MKHPLISLLVLTLVSPTLAQSSSALIGEQLDKQVEKLELNTTLPKAMASIADQTGVPIKADPAVWQLLPWGEQTNITAKIEHLTLRESLEAIARKLGLTFELKEEAVELQPLPALKRLGRRSTVQELQALDLLASTPLPAMPPSASVGDLLAKIDNLLESGKTSYAIENRAGTNIQSVIVPVPRNATMMSALESIAKETDATWYPWGKSIVIQKKQDLLRSLLARTITVRYNGVDVQQVLMELSQRAGVPFSYEPGALQRIPAEFRTIKLILDNASVQQALESIAGFTGLGYTVTDRDVHIFNSTAPATPRDRLIGTTAAGVQLLQPESQLPDDVRQYLQFKSKQQIEKLREQMKSENFKPTTQPVSKPTGEDL